MQAAELQDFVARAFERLAGGATLAEVIRLVLDFAEERSGCLSWILIRHPRGGLRTASERSIAPEILKRAESVDLDRAGSIPEIGLFWEPLGGGLGAWLTKRAEEGDPSDEERISVRAWAFLAAIMIQRKRHEDELRHRESELRAVVDTVIDAIITIDQRGIVESFNRSAERMFGYGSTEVIGRNVSMLMGPEHAEHHDGYIHRYLETGEKRIIGVGREVMARRKDGSFFPVDLGVSELAFDETRKFIGVLREMTERKKLEAEVRQSQKLEAIGTLAAGVAHDFNNLLMGIMGCTSVALSKIPEDSPARQFLQEAKSAAERGSKLTRQLLAFSRRSRAERRPISINDVVVRTEVMLGRLITESIELRTELGAVCMISGDPAQIEQILVNLVVNARDAIEEGGTITVRTSKLELDRRPNGPRGRYVSLSVEDTGCGMDEATRSRIFEPFFTTKGPDRGTGLGLSTVYGLVEQHGGFIEVESTIGRGTVMALFFPSLDEEISSTPAPSDRSLRGREVILLVDDDRLVRLAVTHHLRSMGYEVRAAASGKEALEQIARDGLPDLLVSDIVMPDMSGLELLREVRARGPIRVLFMSGSVAQESIPEIAREGAELIPKPFSEEALAKKVREILD